MTNTFINGRLLTIAIFTSLVIYAQAPDNSKTNQRDRGDQTPVADSQKMNKGDTDLARKIRQSVTADKSLSTYAHNVKIVVQDGRVTLRGPVRTDHERDQLEQKAIAIAGNGNVTNQLEIVPKK